jgi:hypothetical protein
MTSRQWRCCGDPVVLAARGRRANAWPALSLAGVVVLVGQVMLVAAFGSVMVAGLGVLWAA